VVQIAPPNKEGLTVTTKPETTTVAFRIATTDYEVLLWATRHLNHKKPSGLLREITEGLWSFPQLRSMKAAEATKAEAAAKRAAKKAGAVSDNA
jgi:nitric oxide reductase activation protein